MGMFLNYHSISDNYTPNNLIKAFPCKTSCSKLFSTEGSKPFEEYDAKGNIEGYYWRYGDTLNLEFHIDGEIMVEDNAIILKSMGEVPTEDTVGYVGQRCYNIIDLISWTCVAKIGRDNIWNKDEVFSYPLDSKNSIYIDASEYLKDKSVVITLYNFRMEPIHRYETIAVSPCIFPITRKLSESMPKGIYYCSLEVSGKETNQTVFSPEDCKFLVK